MNKLFYIWYKTSNGLQEEFEPFIHQKLFDKVDSDNEIYKEIVFDKYYKEEWLYLYKGVQVNEQTIPYLD